MTIRRLKEQYIEFNETKEKDLNKIAGILNALIIFYSHSSLVMFRDFSGLLKKYK